MLFHAQQKSISKAVNIVGKSVSGNNTLPVLNNILLRADKEKQHVCFTATNLEMAVLVNVEAAVEKEGEITIPAKLITSYVSYLKDSDVAFSLGASSTLHVTSASSKTNIKGISAEEFPSIPEVSGSREFLLPSEAFLEAVNCTVFSASANVSRPVLNGVLFCGEKNTISLVSTDSFRLSRKTISLDKEVDDFSVLVPSRTLQEVLRIFSGEKREDILVRISDNQILFSFGSITVISRLIDGKFPAYEQIIPSETKVKAELSREDLLFTLKRISFFARENNNSVRLSFFSDKLVLSTELNQYGSEEDEIKIQCVGGEEKIALNIDFLIEVCSTLRSEKILFAVNNKLSPAVISSVDDKDGYVHIIMPLKI